MKICLRRAVHISAAHISADHISATDEHTEIDMEKNMVVDIGEKSEYIQAFWPRKDSQSASLRSI